MPANDRPPAFQFYPADWQNDIKLQVCSMAAQGLLINLMCLMHQSEKYGYLLVNGAMKPSKVVSKLLRLSPRTFDFLLNELLSNGVLKQDESGCVYCQRMVKDQRLREIRRDAGAKGGNPALVGGKDNGLVNQTSNQNPTPSSSSSSSSSKEKTFPENSDEFQMASLLYSLIRNNDPKFKQPNLQKWAEHIDKLIRLDGREKPEITRVIHWCQNDDFWQDNILSTQKLRKQYPALRSKMLKQSPSSEAYDDESQYSESFKRILAEREAAKCKAADPA